MERGKHFGLLLIIFAFSGAVFYFAWWIGAVPFLNPEDAVRLTALAVALAFFLIIGFVGYVAASTKPPKPLAKLT